MKRCSTCGRTYTDSNLSFCIDDGTPLTTVEAQDETTVVTPNRSGSDDWNGAAYRPPSSYVQPATPARRRVWPWIVGIGGAFILGILAISIAAAILAPKLLRTRQNEPANNEQANRSTGTVDTRPSENTNVAEPANTNSNTNQHVDIPPPTDHDEVLSQLSNLENEWTIANLKADKEALRRILADDYVGAGLEGAPQGKAEYIRAIRPDTTLEKWAFRDLKLALAGDRATLSGEISLVTDGAENLYVFKDRFVWRDGRWQATGSEVARKNEKSNVNNH
jgi:Domain of unknown function (DUF4440)